MRAQFTEIMHHLENRMCIISLFEWQIEQKLVVIPYSSERISQKWCDHRQNVHKFFGRFCSWFVRSFHKTMQTFDLTLSKCVKKRELHSVKHTFSLDILPALCMSEHAEPKFCQFIFFFSFRNWICVQIKASWLYFFIRFRHVESFALEQHKQKNPASMKKNNAI